MANEVSDTAEIKKQIGAVVLSNPVLQTVMLMFVLGGGGTALGAAIGTPSQDSVRTAIDSSRKITDMQTDIKLILSRNDDMIRRIDGCEADIGELEKRVRVLEQKR